MSLPLWTLDEIAAATGARIVGRPSEATGVSIDTRTLAPGDLFFAIKGDVHDGHGFVRDALAKGAAAAVVAEDRAAEFAGAGPLLVAPDVLDAMRRLGIAARRRSNATIVAVTGSVGKTGTKEAMRLAFERLGSTHASVASYNNHWGVPLTLARLPRDAAYGVFEIGMNHAGEIEPLTRMVRPHVAVITTVEPVHIEFFRSISAIADAKGEIFCGIEPGGTAVLNRDNASFERVRAHALASAAGRVISFGASADVRAERIILKPELSVVEARVLGEPLVYRVGAPGRHVAMNSLAVLAAVKAAGGDLALAALGLTDLRPPAGRGERIWLSAAGGDFLLVDEAFNANPASMRAALANLAATEPQPRGRRLAVIGDMLELGAQGPALHRELAPAVVASGADLVFAAGPLMTHLVEGLPPERRGGYAASAAELEAAVLANVRAGDVVMVKGSKGILVSRIVKALKERYGEAHGRAAAKG
ncbi:MAG TPA: UDP-N-acetylmuramoylalanyl-D-glutamyl-2,6-diaminopimelate--D-alanyl-D-alanine ligase [Beijerinckiaceae bacterium]|nr:UDP-N-acetylmuramoylalanyl-D-glutamyl-2,6-diaminopimelate--D-alanyl-D-alanine ligase [Beijerinckiaceae bacterium]